MAGANNSVRSLEAGIASLSPGEAGPRSAHSTSVSVDDSETWVEAKRYTVYKVVVRTSERAWCVFRR